jgi:hypothetical protein
MGDQRMEGLETVFGGCRAEVAGLAFVVPGCGSRRCWCRVLGSRDVLKAVMAYTNRGCRL